MYWFAICLLSLFSMTAKFSYDDAWPRLACYQGEKEKKTRTLRNLLKLCQSVILRRAKIPPCKKPSDVLEADDAFEVGRGGFKNVQESSDFDSLYLMSDATVRPSVEIFHRVTAAD